MSTGPVQGLLLPHGVRENFLPPTLAQEILSYAVGNEALFRETGFFRVDGGQMDPDIRRSVGTRELGPFRQVLESHLFGILEELQRDMSVAPIPEPRLELELVAHNDGSFYRRHIDTTGRPDEHSLRAISCVYYLNAEPRAFAGGELRLYAIGDPEWRNFIDIEPQHNMLLTFPAFVPHEVRPVSCPGRQFRDSRFAVTGWIHRPRPPRPG